MKIYVFDDENLRFDRKYLQEMRLSILQLPIEEQSEFVDGITYSLCKKGIPLISTELVNAEEFPGWNVTSIGNLAFIALNHPAHEQQVYAKAILQKIKDAK